MQDTIIEDDIKTGYIYGLFASDRPMLLWECRYVGKTHQTLTDRLNDHLGAARRMDDESYRNRWIASVVRRGAAVIMQVLETHGPQEKFALNRLLAEREKVWIASGRAQGWRLTNTTDGGDGALGYRHSEETKQRWSEQRKGQNLGHTINNGRKHTEESRANMAASHIGKTGHPMSEENKRLTSERAKGNTWRRGATHTEATKEKIRAKRALQPPTRTGSTMPEELKQMLSEINTGNQYAKGNQSRTGQPHTDETKAKISVANTGKKRTPEQRANMSGKSPSAETRAKQSASAKARHERERLEKEQAVHDDDRQ